MDILIDYAYRESDLAALPIEELALFALEREGMPANTEVSVAFVDNAEIASLNSEFRGHEGPTDVLSFECDMDEEDEAFPEGEVFELGDVIIAPDVAEAQTAIFSTTFEQEISLLLVHGLLHLCGYDHIEDEDAVEMQARERDILGAWFALRGLGDDLSQNPVDYEPVVLSARITAMSALPGVH